MIILRNLLIFCAGLAVGYTFADIDLAPPLLIRHRSFWTHGPIIPAVILYFAPGGLWLYFLAPFLLSYALHLLKDMFPKAWKGGALIKLFPIRGSLGPALSFIWLGLGALGAVIVFYLAYWPTVAGWVFFWR